MENVAARICREAGGRVTTNVMVRDLDMVGPHVDDARRLGTGLLFLGSARSRHNAGQCSADRRLSQEKGCAAGPVAAEAARQRNVRTYPGLVGPHRRVLFVVLALEVGRTLVKRRKHSKPSWREGESMQRNAVDGSTGGTCVASPVERVNGVCCGLWLLPCWSCPVLAAPVATHFRDRMWSGSGVSMVWLGEVGVLWHWCAVRCSSFFTASV